MEINARQFYLIGAICFFIISAMNLINLVLSFNQINIYSKIGSSASIIFNVVVCLFFLTLLRQSAPVDATEPEDMEEIIENLKNGR